MNRINDEVVAIYPERYGVLETERRDRKGEFRLRAEAVRALNSKRGPGPLDRVLAGAGDCLIWLRQKLKKRIRTTSPAAV